MLSRELTRQIVLPGQCPPHRRYHNRPDQGEQLNSDEYFRLQAAGMKTASTGNLRGHHRFVADRLGRVAQRLFSRDRGELWIASHTVITAGAGRDPLKDHLNANARALDARLTA